VRSHIAKCLERRRDRIFTSRCHTLNLAFCYELGFGVRRDIVKYSRTLLSSHDISTKDLEDIFKQLKRDLQPPEFQNGIFRKFLEQGHFNAFDYSQRYREEQRSREAESRYEREVETIGSVLGDGHRLVQELRVQLSHLMMSEGRWKDAEKLRVQVRMIEFEEVKCERQDTERFDLDLAMVYRRLGRWKEAEEFETKMMETNKRVLGAEHLYTLTNVANLASIFSDLGKYEAAEKMNRRALNGSEKVLGVKHSDTLTSASNLALMLQSQGKYKAAEKMSRRALNGREKVLGVEHLNTLSSVSNLASMLQYQGKYEAAEEMNRRALDGREKVLGVEHPDTLNSVYWLAYLFHTQKRYNDASVLYLRASEGFSKTLGPDHPTIRECSQHYSSMIHEMESQGRDIWLSETYSYKFIPAL